MNKHCWHKILIIVTTAILFLGGCGILPQEEQYPKAPVANSYENKEYTQAAVRRGDLFLYEGISCKFTPAEKETLRFSLGGEYFEGIYVSEGQQVKAGDLLAELDHSALAEQVLEKEYNLKELQLKKAHSLEDMELERKQVDIWASEDDEAYLENKAAFEEKYRKQLQSLEDNIYIESLRLAELKEAVEKRKLYAGIDGTVTFAKDFDEKKKSVEEESVVVISNMDTAAFVVSGEKAALFTEGQKVSVASGNKKYEVVVVECSEKLARLQLLSPDPTLEEWEIGRIELLLDSRKDVLYVDRLAVKKANGKHFVYMLKESGLKVMQDVTVGLETSDYVEIISGLKEGDRVILE